MKRNIKIFCPLLSIVTIIGLIYLLLHYLLLSVFGSNNLATILNISMVLSIFLGGLIGWFFWRYRNLNLDILSISLFGAGATCFFGLSLYGFIGPVCADRSLSAHMVLILKESSEKLSVEKLKDMYTQDMILDKRLQEHQDTGIIKIDENNNIVLQKKGERIAIIYEKMIEILNLKRNYREGKD